MDGNKKELNAVHERDLETLLEKIGLKEAFLNNELRCKFCEQVVNTDNIYSVLPQSSRFNFICDKPECINLLLQYMEERKKTRIEQD